MKWAAAVVAVASCAHAAVINIVPGDSFAKIEAARAGDEVVIAPGVYNFRVHFTADGSPAQPIIIRAADPNNRPVWNFGTTLVENAPGSYTAGDRGRGGWQFSGASNYRVSGIVFQNCRNASRNSSGIRYYNGSTNLIFSDCLFYQNDNGLTGGTQSSEAAAEFCEFSENGNTLASAPTHNIYIFGGKFTLRYSYLHDPTQGQNFHIRSHTSTLEYNFFARAKSYEGDLMTDDDILAGPYAQTMLLRGNLFLQNTNVSNRSQVVVAFNDGGIAGVTMSIRALYNTFVGHGYNSAFVHLANADGTQMFGEVSNNILYNTTRAVLNDNAAAGTITGGYNWLSLTANAGTLTNTVRSADPGFRNAAAGNYGLAVGSPAIGAATLVYGLPGLEYATPRSLRMRAAARDLGAFESTSPSVTWGYFDGPVRPQLTINSNRFISWPLFASNFQLQQAGLDFVWSPSPLNVTTNLDGHFASPANPAFFRLYRP